MRNIVLMLGLVAAAAAMACGPVLGTSPGPAFEAGPQPPRGTVTVENARQEPGPRHRQPVPETLSLRPVEDYLGLVDPEFALPIDPALPAGTLVEARFRSHVLGKERPAYVYLPPGYSWDGPALPVVVLLHGIGGEKAEWAGYGMLQAARSLIAQREVQPMVLVFPSGDQSFWMNHAFGGPAWGEYASRELVQWLEATFNVAQDPGGRAVGGLSKGASGALHLGLSFPDAYGVVAAHSPALRTFEEALPFLADELHFSRVDPLSIAARGDVPPGLIIRIDSGERDDWLERTLLMSALLDRQGIQHDLVVGPGAHDAYYWWENAGEYLRFYDRAFRANGFGAGLQAQLP